MTGGRRLALRWLLAALYGFIGAVHLARPDALLPIMPGWVPEPRLVIGLTGLCELAGAAGLLVPRVTRLSGIMLALYAVCVFPANVKHALEGVAVAGLPDTWWYHGPRLMLQPLIAWLPLYATHGLDWPFGPAKPGSE